MNAIPALLKFLVLIALFLLASHANEFTSLCLVAENQVQVNHLIQFQQPINDPTNEPSHEPTSEPIKRMDLDAELPNNLLPQKTQVAYSEPKQNAELPSKNTDLTNTQTCGLCQNKKSEPESLAEQLIAATNSPQRELCHDKKSETESLAEQPIAKTNSSQYKLPAGLGLRSANFTLPAGLGLRSANFTLPAGLDLRSANLILSAGLGLRSARTINFPAGFGLCSANSSNLSACLGLHVASWNSNETFKLVVASVKNKYSKGLSFTRLPAPNNNPISSFKFIVESASEGAFQIILWTPYKLFDALSSEGA
jgi:hypothetical protein